MLRKLAHAAEYAVLGALLRTRDREPRLAFALAVLYAISDELHQLAVPGRRGAPLDVAIDAPPGSHRDRTLAVRASPPRVTASLLIDLDGALGDTRPLWDAWLADAQRGFPWTRARFPPIARWRRMPWTTPGQELARPARALRGRPGSIYLRPDATTSAALRQLAGSGVRLGAFTDAPAELPIWRWPSWSGAAARARRGRHERPRTAESRPR